MASRNRTENVQAGDILMVVHEFNARSPDELSLKKGDRIELIERDDDFGDGWYLGKHLQDGTTGLFPEVYTVPAPRPTLAVNPPARSERGERSEPAIPPLEPTHNATAHPTTSATEPQVAVESTEEKPLEDTSATPSDSADSPEPPAPLQTTSFALNSANRSSLSSAPRTSVTLPLGAADVGSPVMAEALSVIDEHITDMNTPRQSLLARSANDSGSEYSSHVERRLSYINGSETDEEESSLHTEAEVMKWTPAQVSDYLNEVGVQKKHCDIFLEQEINGEALLGMDQTTIFLKEFELGPVGPRLRTWLKIKALQQEVKTIPVKRSSQQVTDDSASETGRTRATSMSTVLPRIPSLRESAGSRTSSRQGVQRITSTPVLQGLSGGLQSAPISHPEPISPEPTTASTTTSPAFGHAKRPSAASVRSMNQNRRHSSIDVSAEVKVNSPASPQKQHAKQPSFDRHWTMSGATPKTAEPSLSRFDTDDSSRELLPPLDIDRGYFSGNEVDNRKARNVLRKRESGAHSRTPSYTTDSSRRSAPRRHSRFGSADVSRESTHVSPAARIYYGQSQRGIQSTDAVGKGMIRPPPISKDAHPTITKLDFANSPSIDAIAASPNVAGSDTSSLERPSPSPAATSHSFFSKKTARSMGLRAISDAITGSEKALFSSHSSDMQNSPIKESPLQSPARTGSSTPSGASKSFEFEDEKVKHTTTITSIGSKPIPPRKRTKKTTSAYLRGLEQKAPQEQMRGCDYSGWMKKKSSNLMTTWKTRLFVLRGRRLSYYYSEMDTEEKGLIDISNHRVLPANNELTTMMHATITGATSSPSSPQNASIPTAASTDEKGQSTTLDGKDDARGMFIFKLVPPRTGLSKGVNFTKPTVHYFAVDNVVQGRLWMAALIKATIDRDPEGEYTSSYAHKTISLAKARGMNPKPYFIKDDDDDIKEKEKDEKGDADADAEKGLGIGGVDDFDDNKKDSGIAG